MLTLPPNAFLVFGHRGASAHAPENTLAAFRLTAEQGGDGVELDVRRTADGALVVHHDAGISGVGTIAALSLDEIRGRAPDVATFAEAMSACGDLIVNVEIKNSPMEPDFDPEETVAEEVAEWVAGHGWSDRVIVSSFNPTSVDRVRRLDAELATGQLIDPGSDAARQLITAHQRGHRALHPHISCLTEPRQLSAMAAELGMWLLAWTVDDPGTIRGLREAGITGVITNDPAAAVAALA
jgi:glycerophosphoryl diester phosphodiesterase